VLLMMCPVRYQRHDRAVRAGQPCHEPCHAPPGTGP
jgi:hypothetical protein